ncbi:uncharacterized protein [Nicotiana tomentosiformis]|uniref:uncharacterized protein n=1 Tax=Nicotiana tomentosiformis TaxID=4098 RepID=UPI00388C9157
MCRMSTVENIPFRVVEEIPLGLYMWWNDLGKVSKRSVTKALGGLTGLLKIKPRVDIIEALTPFWDPTHNVFHFSDFEVTPTLEEIAGYQYPVAPRTVTPHKFLDLLSISRQVKDENLARGFCTFRFLYSQYGYPHRFEAPDTGLNNQGNKDKWEARKGLTFVVAFLGTLICPRSDKHIELGLAGVAEFMVKKANGTIIPMILAEIYRALTTCRAGIKFFEGCNLLLQMWLVEHLSHRPGYMNYGLTRLNCIKEYENRVNGHELPEGTEAWFMYLGSLNSNRIEWTFGWLQVDEVIYMSAGVCFLLLMGLRSIQPYAPHRVLRQLGRYQKFPYDKDLSPQVIELCPKAIFPEERVRQIWHQCRFLEPETQVRDLSMGEVGSNYTIWYGKRSRVDQEPELPAKRSHVQQFTDGAREQWVWLAKEKEYRTIIKKLEEQIENIKFDSSLQAVEDEGEKKRFCLGG